jgi:hypothetical protein
MGVREFIPSAKAAGFLPAFRVRPSSRRCVMRFWGSKRGYARSLRPTVKDPGYGAVGIPVDALDVVLDRPHDDALLGYERAHISMIRLAELHSYLIPTQASGICCAMDPPLVGVLLHVGILSLECGLALVGVRPRGFENPATIAAAPT